MDEVWSQSLFGRLGWERRRGLPHHDLHYCIFDVSCIFHASFAVNEVAI